jgi:hypothetical protein
VHTRKQDGAIDAQPNLKMARKMMQMYADDIVIVEEKRDLEMPDLKKDWWNWRYSG